MKVLTLKIQNICNTEQLDLDLSKDSFVLLMGANGSGKSTVMACIGYLLFGQLPDTRDTKEKFQRRVVGGHATPSTISGTFRSRGRTVTIQTSLTTGSWSLQIDQDKPITGAKNVATARQQLLGLDPAMARYAYIQQKQLHRWLFEQPAKRTAELQRLFGADRGEAARKYLGDMLGRVNAPDLTAAVMTCEKAVEDARQQLTVLQADASRHQQVITGINIAEVEQVIASAEKAIASGAMIGQVNEHIAKVDESTRSQNDMLTGLLRQIETYQTNLSTWAEQCQRYIAERDAESGLREKTQQLLTAQRQLQSLVSPVRPVWNGDLDAIRKEIADLTAVSAKYAAELVNARQREADLRNHRTGKCDVCGAPCTVCATHSHTAEQLSAASQQVKLLEQEKNVTDLRLTPLVAQLRVYDDQVAKYAVAQATYASQHQMLSTTVNSLAGLPPLPTDEHVRTRAEFIQRYTETDKALGIAEGARVATVTRLQQLSQEKGVALQLLEKVTREAQAGPSREAVVAANAQRDMYTASSGALSQLKHTIAAAEVNYRNRQTDLVQITEKNERNVIIRKFASYLSQIRDVLHRDRLPARVAAQYMHLIAAKCNITLPLTGADYVVFLKDNDFYVRRPSGVEMSAAELSGGEASRWSLSFLFALHDMFARNIGMLLLDEPTSDVDDNGVSDFAETLGYFKDHVSTDETQFIVATHHVELSAAADRVVTLTKQ